MPKRVRERRTICREWLQAADGPVVVEWYGCETATNQKITRRSWQRVRVAMPMIEASVISERAYSIWEREGRPAGKALDHWLQAEAELNGVPTPDRSALERDPVETTPAAKAVAGKTPGRRSARKSRA